jgi:hypothetical protein
MEISDEEDESDVSKAHYFSKEYFPRSDVSNAFVTILHAFTEFGSGEWIGIVLCALVLFSFGSDGGRLS